MDNETLSKIRNNVGFMRASYLESSGAISYIESLAADDSFKKWKTKEKIDYILSGCLDRFCPECNIGRLKVGSQYCSAKCVGRATRHKTSDAQKANASERMRKSRETMLSRYGVEHNNHLPHCIESRAKKREQFVIRERTDTFKRYDLDINDFDKKTVERMIDSCETLDHLASTHFGGMPKMTVWRYIDYLGIDKRYSRTSSNGEREIAEFVESLGFRVSRNNRSLIPSRKTNSFYEIDVLVEDVKLGIEYHGLWCHGGNEKRKDHLWKNKKMTEMGYGLIQIFEDEWRDKRDIIKGIISARLGVFEKKYQARKLRLDIVESKSAREFLDANHIQGAINGTHYGLFDGTELVSMITIGKSRFKNNESIWELLRYATKIGCSVTGGFDRLIKEALRSRENMITYCDLRLFSGKTYARKGTLLRVNGQGYSWVDPSSYKRINRVNLQKHKLPSILGEKFDASLTERQNLEASGYTKIWDCGQSVYLLEHKR